MRRRITKDLHPRSSVARRESFCPLDKDLSWKSDNRTSPVPSFKFPVTAFIQDVGNYFRLADNTAGSLRGWTAAFAGSVKAITESLDYCLISDSPVNGIRGMVVQVRVEKPPTPIGQGSKSAVQSNI
jgi:hypothetical protein